MDKFLTELPRDRKAEDEASPKIPSKPKTRKSDYTNIVFGFICTVSKCLLATAWSQTSKDHIWRQTIQNTSTKLFEFFRHKFKNCLTQQYLFAKAASVRATAQLPHIKLLTKWHGVKKPHTIAEELTLPRPFLRGSRGTWEFWDSFWD